MPKKKILCIVGTSGSGKTTVSLLLKERLDANIICSYTTRPMRDGETNGKEHIFITDSELPSHDDMLAYTYFGGYHYFATHEQVHGDCSVYVIDEIGLDELKSRFSERYDIRSILIIRPQTMRSDNGVDTNRMDRDLNRDLSYERFDDIIMNETSDINDVYNKVETIYNNFING